MWIGYYIIVPPGVSPSKLNRKLAETQEFLNSPELYNDSSKMNLHDLLRDQVNLDTEIKSTEQEWLELNEELENG